MHNQKSQKMPITVINKLRFDLEKCIDPRINMFLELSDVLNISKEGVYRRFRGVTQFTLNELWILINHYDISIDLLFDQNKSISTTFTFISIRRLGIDTYFNELESAFSRFPQPADIHVFATSIPLYRLLSKPTISKFKQAIWSYLNNKSHPIPKGDCFTQVKPISFLKINNKPHEIWSYNASNFILKQIDYTLSCGFNLSLAFLYELFSEIIQIVNDAIFRDDDRQGVLYFSEIDIHADVYCDMSHPKNIILLFGDDLAAYSFGTNGLRDIDSWTKGILTHSVKISGQSVRQKRAVYEKIVHPIYASAKSHLNPEWMTKLQVGRMD
jgi:hypothetical protein